MNNKLTVGVISLGCDKNRVDTEKMLAFLQPEYNLTSTIENADIIIINTCAFLESSRKEAIEEIFGACSLKQSNPNLKVVVTGCLPQKFIDEIFDEMFEVDGFLGISDYDKIVSVLKRVTQGERVNCVGSCRGECSKKRVLTTNGYAYLKISDGCNNHCTYCLIPKIRGAYRSVDQEFLIEEAKGLGRVEELILVAQDTTQYGVDLTPKTTLTQLIKNLSKLDSICRIRLLYCYPENITDELILEIKNNPKVIKYIDIPLQHADDRVLKLMNRKGTGAGYLDLINKLKQTIPEIAIRSTFITGFPGEDQTAFENLINFLQQAKLFNAGFFAYSREQDTPAYKLVNQVEEKVKKQRLKKLYSCQKKIVKQNFKQFIGKTIQVFAEGFDQDTFTYYGRAYFNAPQVDGKVYFFSSEQVDYGKTYQVKIIKSEDYDLYGERL